MEIERKFVLQSLPEGVHSGREVLQGYLCFDPEVRLRKIGAEHKLTIKSGGSLTREETEKPILVGLFNLLWTLVGSNVVRKKRYLLDYEDRVLEVDVYAGKHEGLITLECEFQSPEQAELFELPDWIGTAVDVTGDPRFKNKELSRARKIPDL